MNTRNLNYRIFLALIIGLSLSACRITILEADEGQATQEGEVIGMANPAAQYCEGLGYRYQSVEREGGVDADCVFPAGDRCSQWDFLAGRCGQEMSYCEMQAGGTIQASGNLGICTFSDGSTCNELELFNGICTMGENPSQVDQETETEDTEEDTEVEETEDETIQVTSFTAARDHLMAYFADQYGIVRQGDWMETDITTPNPEAVNTFRYVSGSLTIVLSAGAAAPYVPLYTVQEAADLGNGFYWTGTIALDGAIVENEVVLPWLILSRENARDAVLEFIFSISGITSPPNWVDEGISQAGDTKLAQIYSSGSWLVTVEFEPAAPFVSSYNVTVGDSSSGLRWEGDISGQGEIVQISFVQ